MIIAISTAKRDFENGVSPLKCFRAPENYITAISQVGAAPVLLPYLNPAQATQIFTHIDGLIIIGGKDIPPDYYQEKTEYPMKEEDRQRVDSDFALMEAAIQTQTPVLGICYGLQLINVYFGGTLYQDINRQLSWASFHGSGDQPVTHRVQLAENFKLAQFLNRNKIEVISTHHQAIKTPGSKLSPAAFSLDGVIEAIVHQEMNIIGVQWHPEKELDATFFFKFFYRICAERKSA